MGCNSDTNDEVNGNSEVNNNDINNDSYIEEDPDPITLTIMMWDDWGQDFEKHIVEAVEDEFPHITLNSVGGDTGNKERIEDEIAEGTVPDIIFAHRQYHVPLLREYGLAFDMTDLLEKHAFDLSRYETAHLEEWKAWTGGEIWLLPFMRDIYGLLYNKDIFDLFGVEYPTDDMTWDEILNMAAELTGIRDDRQYIGIDLRSHNHVYLTQVIGDSQLIDPETDEVLWTEDESVKKWLEMVERTYQMPEETLEHNSYHYWVEERTLALLPLWLERGTPEDLNVDIAVFPEWQEAPGVGPMAGGWAFGITEPSEHKDAAMEVLKFLYEDENIVHLGESPIHAPFDHLYKDYDFDEALAHNELFEPFIGTNVEALYELSSPSGPEYRSEYDDGAFQVIENLGNDFIDSGLDINSFLRELKEEEEIRIKDEKAKGY